MSAPIAALARKIRLALGRGVLTLVDDGLLLQRLQLKLLQGEVRDDVRRYQEYGLSSHPKPGSTAIAAALGGNRNHLVVVLVDGGQYRKRDLQEGEVALYHCEGDYILLKNGREIEIVSGSKVTVTAPLVELSGDLTVAGTITGGVVRTESGIGLGTHKHGGVQAGGAQSGGPVP